MRVLYLLHRYHTNQIEIMRGWKEHGDEICLLTWSKGGIEDYTYAKPVVVGYSPVFTAIDDFYMNVIKRNDPFALDMKLRFGIPPMKKIKKYIADYKPDLIILREKSLYTIFTYSYCKRHHYRTFLYNLSPVWAKPSYFKHDLAHRIVNQLTPAYRLTPTHQIGIDMTGKIKDEKAYFAPFLVKPMCAPENKEYFKNGNINIYEIGKYQDRKNHFLMLKVIRKLKQKYPEIKLTIAGEISDHFHEEYYEKLCEYVHEHAMDEYVSLLKNIKYQQSGEEYLKADLFVLPSTGEPASITVIEAMAYSIPAISGTDNGTADYIRPGITGEVFEDCDENDLYAKMDKILCHKENIPLMGKAAYKDILDRFQFKNYYDTICEMMTDQDREKRK